jgi:hypothetical protein
MGNLSIFRSYHRRHCNTPLLTILVCARVRRFINNFHINHNNLHCPSIFSPGLILIKPPEQYAPEISSLIFIVLSVGNDPVNNRYLHCLSNS